MRFVRSENSRVSLVSGVTHSKSFPSTLPGIQPQISYHKVFEGPATIHETVPFSHTPFFYSFFNVGVVSLPLSLRVGSHLLCKLVLVVGQSQGSERGNEKLLIEAASLGRTFQICFTFKTWGVVELQMRCNLFVLLYMLVSGAPPSGENVVFYHFNKAFRTAFIPRSTSVLSQFAPNVSALCFNKDFGNCNCVSSSTSSSSSQCQIGRMVFQMPDCLILSVFTRLPEATLVLFNCKW